MIKLIFILLLSNNLLLAAQLIDENTSILDIVTEAKLPDGTIHQTFKVRGGSRFNTGKYGTNTCSGHRVFNKEKLSELRNICEFSINDGYKFWTKAERSQSDIDAGVGKATIIDGTGPYKNTKGAKCLYAISFHEEIVFTNIKCNLDDQIFNELKK